MPWPTSPPTPLHELISSGTGANVYKLRKIVWQNDFSDHFRKIIIFMNGANIACFVRQTVCSSPRKRTCILFSLFY